MCQFLIKFLLPSVVWVFLIIPCLVQESATCVRSVLLQDEAAASGTKIGIIRWYMWEAQTTPFHTGTFTGARQETAEGFSWQKQLNSLETFTLGCLQEGLSQKSSEVNRALHIPSARIRASIKAFPWSALLRRCPVLGQYGDNPGFSLQCRGEEHYRPKHPLSGTGCLQFSALCETGNESICSGSLSRLG